MKDREAVEQVELPYGCRQSRLLWHKVRWVCGNDSCDMITWTWDDPRIGAPRQRLTRSARWVSFQVGGNGRSVSEIAGDLGCAWHTVNDAVIAYGEALTDNDTHRIGTFSAIRLDEEHCLSSTARKPTATVSA